MGGRRAAAGGGSGPLYGLAGVGILALLLFSSRGADLSSQAAQAQQAVQQAMRQAGLDTARALQSESSEQKQQGRLRYRFIEERYRLPSSFAWDPLRKRLENHFDGRRRSFLRTERSRQGSSTVYRIEVAAASGLEIYRAVLEQPKPPPAQAPPVPAPPVVAGGRPPGPPVAFPRGKGKIAIVLDDWGYNMNQIPELAAIRSPLTVAILPGLPHSAEVAQQAAARGHEVILHMPMEAMDPDEPREKGRTILKGMSKREILELIDRSLTTVPQARGLSNHQGSKVTSDPASMEVILRETKRRGLYFLDSFVTGQSVCAQVARVVRVPFAQRAVFLDNEGSAPRIQERLSELAEAAGEKGQAVGIGHDRPTTLEVLRAAVPELEEAGYTLVPVSDLVE